VSVCEQNIKFWYNLVGVKYLSASVMYECTKMVRSVSMRNGINNTWFDRPNLVLWGGWRLSVDMLLAHRFPYLKHHIGIRHEFMYMW
jgi:hypothetical protein